MNLNIVKAGMHFKAWMLALQRSIKKAVKLVCCWPNFIKLKTQLPKPNCNRGNRCRQNPHELLLQTQATKFENSDEISNFPVKLILLKYNSTKIGRNRSVVTANLFKTLQRPVFPPKCYFKTVSHETVSESKINRWSKNFHFGTTAFNKRQRRAGKRVDGTEAGR